MNILRISSRTPKALFFARKRCRKKACQAFIDLQI